MAPLNLRAGRLPDWAQEWPGSRVALDSRRRGAQQLCFSRRYLTQVSPCVSVGQPRPCQPYCTATATDPSSPWPYLRAEGAGAPPSASLTLELGRRREQGPLGLGRIPGVGAVGAFSLCSERWDIKRKPRVFRETPKFRPFFCGRIKWSNETGRGLLFLNHRKHVFPFFSEDGQWRGEVKSRQEGGG